MTIQIKDTSFSWAIKSIIKNSDGDICPRIVEYKALAQYSKEFIASIKASNIIQEHNYGSHRRFVVPKSLYSHRLATQLYPQDSIILTAIIKQYGRKIENRRLQRDRVFSYRFQPSAKFDLYDRGHTWNNFWEKAKEHIESYKFALYMDISDFYNQINHHDIENQLNESKFPKQITKWIIGLFASTTGNISRGVPIGPHATHLIAESSLIPFDQAMQNCGYEYIRYVDDILIFFNNRGDAPTITANIVDVLDRHHKLTLQNNKTKIFCKKDFKKFSSFMIDDRPINSIEKELLDIISRYSKGNPYLSTFVDEISEDDWKEISEKDIGKIITSYLQCKHIDYMRLSWFYRRLSQTGHPSALQYSLKNINKLLPCFSSICSYIMSISKIEKNEWKALGEKLYRLLERSEISNISYFKASILSLFSNNKNMNHFSAIASMFMEESDPIIKRELLLSAAINGESSWIQERKQDFQSMNDWERLSMIYASSILPVDARNFYHKQIKKKTRNPLEEIVLKWSGRQHSHA